MPIRTVIFLVFSLVSVLEVSGQTGPTVTTQETIALPAQTTVSIATPFSQTVSFPAQTTSVVTSARIHRMTTAAEPAGANLGRYPLKAKRLTRQEEVELGLRTVALRYDWTGFNFHREVEGGRWIWERLPAGTLVHVDATGNQLYKEDCGNRLVWWPSDPFGQPAPRVGIALPTTRVEPVARQVGRSAFLNLLGDRLRTLAGNIWQMFGDWLRVIGWLLLALVPIAILFFLVWAFSDFIRWLDDRDRGRRPVVTSPVPPQAPVSGPRPAPRGLARILPWRWSRSEASQNAPRPSAPTATDVQSPVEGARPTRPTTTRRFMTFSSPERNGDPDERIRFAGYRRVDLNIEPDTESGEVTTIRLYRS